MPSAATMLAAYRVEVTRHAGGGQAGLAAQARFGPAVRALQTLIDSEFDPRKPPSGGRLAPRGEIT